MKPPARNPSPAAILVVGLMAAGLVGTVVFGVLRSQHAPRNPDDEGTRPTTPFITVPLPGKVELIKVTTGTGKPYREKLPGYGIFKINPAIAKAEKIVWLKGPMGMATSKNSKAFKAFVFVDGVASPAMPVWGTDNPEVFYATIPANYSSRHAYTALQIKQFDQVMGEWPVSPSHK